MTEKDKAQFPIIYLRGYAGSQGEVEDTVATPYMGFNLGATKLRQAHDGKILVNVFESPLIRLMKDHDYVDAFRDGQTEPPGPIDKKSIWIFRYYDVTSEDVGPGERREIEFHAARLREFIIHVREATATSWPAGEDFRVHLVAHSMGGLVCRCYLQNSQIPGLDGSPARTWQDRGVDKLFTYATPHGGIEFRNGLGWAAGLRDFFDPNNAGNFGPKRMREFLDLSPNQPLNSLGDRFPTERVLCMVGTDSKDYTAAAGMSRRAVGPMSDGLVMIRNAVVQGAPRAFVHRSHSGHYGIVNSESCYQNLTRFLFGNVRVDGTLIVEELSLPKKIKKAYDDDKQIRASYHFETVVRVRGERWDLHRRLVNEGSAIFRTFDELFRTPSPRHPRLFTTFLSLSKRTNARRKSLGIAIDLAVQVPTYEVDREWWPDDHYEGGYLFRDKLNLEITTAADGEWSLRYGLDSKTPNRATKRVAREDVDGAIVFNIPIDSNSTPGIKAMLKLQCSPWNVDSTDE